MSRSVADATRFTATSPHAFSKPAASRFAAGKAGSPTPRGTPLPQSRPLPSSPGQKPGDSGETPSQKVARLRAAHAAKRLSEISTWDKVVVRGREMADTAHKITVTGLVGLTILAAGVTAYSLGDMMLYNKRKKKEWFADQHQKWQEALRIAQEAEALGNANEGQMLLLQRERAAEAAEEERKNRSIWKAIKRFLSSEGLKAEEARTGEQSPPTNFIPKPQSFIYDKVQEQRREAEREMERQGVEPGPLDKMAEQAAKTATRPTTSSDVD